MSISKISISILFAASLVFSGCTVHHYHHNVPSKSAKKGKHAKHGKKRMHGDAHQCPCSRRLPKGHPPVGHGMKNPHGANPHGPMDPHHGMKGQGANPHHGDHGTAPTAKDPFAGAAIEGHDAAEGHHALKNVPEPVQSFHDAFAAAWHLESDEERKAKACADIANFKRLASKVKAHRLIGAGTAEYAGASAELVRKTNALGVACKRKQGDVQAALKDTHDSLHDIFKAVQMSSDAPKSL